MWVIQKMDLKKPVDEVTLEEMLALFRSKETPKVTLNADDSPWLIAQRPNNRYALFFVKVIAYYISIILISLTSFISFLSIFLLNFGLLTHPNRYPRRQIKG